MVLHIMWISALHSNAVEHDLRQEVERIVLPQRAESFERGL